MVFMNCAIPVDQTSTVFNQQSKLGGHMEDQEDMYE